MNEKREGCIRICVSSKPLSLSYRSKIFTKKDYECSSECNAWLKHPNTTELGGKKHKPLVLSLDVGSLAALPMSPKISSSLSPSTRCLRLVILLFDLSQCDGETLHKSITIGLWTYGVSLNAISDGASHIKLCLGVCLLNGLLPTNNLYTNTKVKMRHTKI